MRFVRPLNPLFSARIVVERNFNHSNIVATIKRMPFPLKLREFVMKQVCCTHDGAFMYGVESVDGVVVDYGMNVKKVVRGRSTGFVKITPAEDDENQCHLELLSMLDAGGIVPQ